MKPAELSKELAVFVEAQVNQLLSACGGDLKLAMLTNTAMNFDLSNQMQMFFTQEQLKNDLKYNPFKEKN